MRNIYKTAAEGKKILQERPEIDLTSLEIDEFFNDFDDREKDHGVDTAVWNSILTAFRMGVAVGVENTKR